MNGECVNCRRQNLRLYEASIYDTGGVAHLELCRYCRDRLERRAAIYQPTVCVLCRQHSEPRRSEGLQFVDAADEGENSVFHLCDDCRHKLLGLGGGQVVSP